MTQLISLSCNHCGAPIDVPRSSRFVTCTHCNSRLAIKSTGNSSYTEVLDALETMNQRSESMAEDLGVIRLQNEIEKLDREWAVMDRSLSYVNREGQAQKPNAYMAVIVGVLASAFGGFFVITTLSMGAPIFMSLFGCIFVGAGLFFAVTGPQKAEKYQRAQAEYERERRQLEERLEQCLHQHRRD